MEQNFSHNLKNKKTWVQMIPIPSQTGIDNDYRKPYSEDKK